MDNSKLPPPPERKDFATQEQYEEAMGRWQSTVGRNLGMRKFLKEPLPK